MTWNPKLLFALLLPRNQGIKRRYDHASREAASLLGALCTAPMSQVEAGTKIYNRHKLTMRAVAHLLLQSTHAEKLSAYRQAIQRDDGGAIAAIEAEFD